MHAINTIDGITVTRETNTVADVIEGVTFEVVGANAGTPATVTVSQDNTAISELTPVNPRSYYGMAKFASEGHTR